MRRLKYVISDAPGAPLGRTTPRDTPLVAAKWELYRRVTAVVANVRPFRRDDPVLEPPDQLVDK